MERGDFYILCPDKRRAAGARRENAWPGPWATSSRTGRPLSRWHPDWAQRFRRPRRQGLTRLGDGTGEREWNDGQAQGELRHDRPGGREIKTGGAQGIGHAVARRLHEAGAHVVLWDIDGALADEAGGGLRRAGRGRALDVTDHGPPSTPPRKKPRHGLDGSTCWYARQGSRAATPRSRLSRRRVPPHRRHQPQRRLFTAAVPCCP